MKFPRLLLALLVSVVTGNVNDKKCVRKENLALQGSASQSGTIRSAAFAKNGDARPAIKEGNKAQCAVAESAPNYFPWWQIDLQESSFKVSNVEIYAPDANFAVGVGNEKLKNFKHILTFTRSTSTCSLGIRNEETGRVSALCDDSGRYVTITKQFNADNLTLCEVEIYGENRTNLAFGKDTKQSSDVYDAVSSLAVDGHLTYTFYSYENGQLKPLCSHTSEEIDHYPWWRVDLGDFFMVKSLDIYNRGETLHTRLHDIEVRVGLVDIAEFTASNKLPDEVVGDVLFTKNQLCVSAWGKYFGSGRQEIHCSQPTLGRYVSIQIVQLCESVDCEYSRANVKNMLTLCEVEVYGERLDFDLKDGEYLSLGSIATSFDDSAEYEEDDEYSWLNIDLQTTDIVYMIELHPEIDTTDLKMPEVEIRVGNEPITSAYNNERFTNNHGCISRITMFRTVEVFCESAVMGRYVTLQLKQCHADNCLDKHMTQDAIKQIKVWGITEKVYKSSWNVALHKPTTQSSVVNSGFSSLAVDKVIPDMNSDDDKCALTVAKYYPWWRIDLKAAHRVIFVSFHLSANTNISLNSDLEVRFGDEDIADQTDDSLFNKNHVCALIETDSSETRFQCDSFDSGRYISVQLNDNSPTAQSLQLCEVEVIGCEL